MAQFNAIFVDGHELPPNLAPVSLSTSSLRFRPSRARLLVDRSNSALATGEPDPMADTKFVLTPINNMGGPSP
jgi:hypothetical protein